MTFFYKILYKPKKKDPEFLRGLNLNLAVPIFPVRYQTSMFGAMDFTSVFGMGTGVTPSLSPPGNFLKLMQVNFHLNLRAICN